MGANSLGMTWNGISGVLFSSAAAIWKHSNASSLRSNSARIQPSLCQLRKLKESIASESLKSSKQCHALNVEQNDNLNIFSAIFRLPSAW